MISAIIATYNGEKYILEQLNSILHQSVPVDEVIVCDDRSQDKTPALVEDFIRTNHLENWHFSINEKNLGPSDNAFRCLTKVSGDIIFLCDQDNVWESNYVEVMSHAMTCDPEMLLLSALCVFIDRNGDFITNKQILKRVGIRRRIGNDTLGYMPFATWLGAAYMALCLTVIRKSVRDAVIEGGIPPLHLSIGIDGYIGLVAAVMGKTCSMNMPLVRFRIHETNYSLSRLRKSAILSSSNEKRLNMLKQATEAHRHLLQNKMIVTRIARDKRKMVEAVIDLYERRASFCEESQVWRGIYLFFLMNRYKWCYNGIRHAMRMWLTDLMYAFGVNWKVKYRANL